MTTRSSDRRLGYTRAHLDRDALAAGADGPLRFIASSTSVNRYGFSLRNEGWLLGNYERNPVFLWAHDTSAPPIGRAPAVRESGVLAAYATFDRDDPFAASVERKYRNGFMTAVSVSWDFVNGDGSPIEDWWRLSPDRMRDECFYDLCEISAVPVPGDPRALRETQRNGLARLGRDLAHLFDEQEHAVVPLEEIRGAVHAELARLGIEIPVRPAEPAADPEPAVEAAPVDPTPEAAAAGIDSQAAGLVLAAFNL